MIDEKNIEAEDMEEEDDSIVILTDEKGNETEFEFLDLIEYKDKEYAVLLPVEEAEDSDQVYIFEVEEEDEETFSYKSVASEKILNEVFEVFKKEHKDEFNFI